MIVPALLMARLARPAKEHQMELAYVGVEVSDRPALDALFRDVVGLLPGEGSPDGASWWRNDDRVYRIAVHDGPSNDARYFGLEVLAADFDKAVERLVGAGSNVTEASELAAARRVSRLVHAETPFGPRVELTTGLAVSDTPFESELVPGGFNTRGLGFGHLVFQTGDEHRFEEANRFVAEGLGFAQSDWFEGTIGPASVLARFYHCNPRHHTLAIALAPVQVPQALNHIMVETVSEDNVGEAFDRAWAAGTAIDSGIGRHDNDRMFSFYVTTSAGFRLEFGTGAREIVEPWTENRRYDRPSIWGHLPVTRPAQPQSATV
jgi:biphenyl-2,3-diol 1,2-dioxygenase